MKKKFLVAITTYGSHAYVDLGLECYSRYPECDCIVLDDCSKDERLMAVCRNRSVPLISHFEKHGHLAGDMYSIARAIQYAYENGYEYVVKSSRRWICLENPFPELAFAIRISDAYTFSNITTTYGFGFRTEFMALHSASWYNKIDRMLKNMPNAHNLLVEDYIHKLSVENQPQSELYKNFMQAQHYKENLRDYFHFPWMGTDRKRSLSVLHRP